MEVERLKEEIQELSKSVVPQANLTYLESQGKKTKYFNKEYELSLYLNKKWDFKFVTEWINNEIIIPNIKSLEIRKIQGEEDLLNKFIKTSFPLKLKKFLLGDKYGELYDWNIFIESLKSILERVEDQVILNQFRICKTELEDIINNTKCPKLTLEQCNIDSSTPLNFTNSYITHLSFYESGRENYSNWNQNKDKLKNILDAIEKSPMKDKLQKIALKYSFRGYME